jgi:L-lysine 2,3-aminomutase
MKNLSSIIPVSTGECQEISWKTLLKSAITDPKILLRALALDPASLPHAIDPEPSFKVRVPQPFLAKMKAGDPFDPLLQQVLSLHAETLPVSGYNDDPLGESGDSTPGVLHKYHGRVLLILSSACAINCRYCFRRHFPYADKLASGSQLQASLDYIRQTPSISEVILSGGDPLIVSDEALQNLIDQLAAIPHVKRLRIHSRLPVVIPQRLTQRLVDILQNTRLMSTLVLHVNHPQEIDSQLSAALQPLRQARVTLFNQAVLLKGINDNSATLIALSESLYDAGIIPYYLHLLDKVAGAAHFDISEARALALVTELRNTLPGYLVPRLAREENGAKAKTVIA